MNKKVLLKRLKNKYFTSKESMYKSYYKKYFRLCNFIIDIADPKYFKCTKGFLRDYQLSTLGFVSSWCDFFNSQNISYFLISGSLLGAYRNGGFIPWDDDIDIGMIRNDYVRLKEYLKEHLLEIDTSEMQYSGNNKYKIVQEYLRKNQGKISYIIYPDYLQILCGDDIKTMKFLEIFPYDYYKDDYDIKEHHKYLMQIKSKIKEIDNFKNINIFLEKERNHNKNIVEKSNKIYYGIDNYDSLFIPCPEWFTEDDIFPLKKILFEGIELSIPNNIEKSLRLNYGNDFMSVPKDIKLEANIQYRKQKTESKNINMSQKKLILKKQLLRKVNKKNQEKLYKSFYKEKKQLYDFLIDIVDINTLKPCKIKLVRDVQLKTLDFCKQITDFFVKNSIEYFMSSGTLLGSLRHKGFIPWDDDFDVGMMRQDYEKLKKILSENFIGVDSSKIYLSKKNQASSINEFIKNNPDQVIYFIGPKYIQLYKGKSMSDCVMLDVFPHDFYSDDYTIQEYENYFNKIRSVSEEKDNFEQTVKFLEAEISNNSNITFNSSQIYFGVDSLDSYLFKHIKFMNKDTIFPLQKMEFEGHEFYAPNKPEEYVLFQYSDYMSFPKEFKIAPFLEERLQYESSQTKF